MKLITMICASRYNGWFATGVSSFIFAGTLSPMAVYGILFVDIGNDLRCKAVQTGMVASVCFALSFMASPVSEYLNRYISYRSLVILGSTLTALSIFTSCFVRGFFGLLVLYGAIYGLSSNFVAHGVLCILSQHFPDENRTMSLGIAMCGTTMGTLILTISYEALLPWRGWRGALGFTSLYSAALAILSSLVLFGPRHAYPETTEAAKREPLSETDAVNLTAESIAAEEDDMPNTMIRESGATDTVTSHSASASVDGNVDHAKQIQLSSDEYRTSNITQCRDHERTGRSTLKRNSTSWKEVLSHPVAFLACMAIFLLTLPWATYFINLVSYYESVQMDSRCLSNLLMVMPFFELFGKAGIGLLEKVIPAVHLQAGHCLLFTIVSAVIALFPVYRVLLVCSMLIGTGRASFLVLSFSVIAKLLPTKDPDKAVTATMVSQGIGFTIGTLPAGAIYDSTGSYKYAIFLNMAFYLLGASILLCTLCRGSLSRSDRKNEVPRRKTISV